ncbi:hypothetical protein AVW12_20385 [Priestia aryabhattai]|nr:hypothetical protein AVW12_20385 [Priestia aryabhattai]
MHCLLTSFPKLKVYGLILQYKSLGITNFLQKCSIGWIIMKRRWVEIIHVNIFFVWAWIVGFVPVLRQYCLNRMRMRGLSVMSVVDTAA